jgi:DNA repair protein RecO (recombination protein O)
VELVLHHGRGELATVTGASLVRSHASVRDDPYRLAVGLVGAEAVLRLFPEQEQNERVFVALTRFLDLLDDAGARRARAELDPLGLSFQLKLLWLAGYLPHVSGCANCGAESPITGFSTRAGGVVCSRCAAGALAITHAGVAGIDALLRQPLALAPSVDLSDRASRDVLAVIAASYEFHGGFRLRTLSA